MTVNPHNISDKEPLRLGRISFINVDPIYYGFDHRNLSNEIQKNNIQVTSAPPSDLNRMLASGALDISSVSSAAYGMNHKEWLLLPGFSIACSGNVMSVLLASRLPLEELDGKRVLATDESATAVRLMRLMFYHKHISPILETCSIHSPCQVNAEASAALVIGDAALRHNWQDSFEYVFDLGDLWARHANLPFVFAVWAVRKKYADARPDRVEKALDLLNTSRRLGVLNIDSVVENAASKLSIDPDTTRRYFNNFNFDLATPQYFGLETFFKDLHSAGIYSEKIHIRRFGQE